VKDIESVRQEIVLQPILTPWNLLLADDLFESFSAGREPSGDAPDVDLETAAEPAEAFPDRLRAPVENLLDAIAAHLGRTDAPPDLIEAILEDFGKGPQHEDPDGFPEDREDLAVLYGWLACRRLGSLGSDEAGAAASIRGWLDDWLLGRPLRAFFGRHSADPDERYRLAALLVGRKLEDWVASSARETLRDWIGDGETARYLNVNRYQGIVWFDADRLERLAAWIETLHTTYVQPAPGAEDERLAAILREISAAAQGAAYQVDSLLSNLDN
jgi:hypothetical protein